MFRPWVCPKCGGGNTAMMFHGYICNDCEPIKAAPVAALPPPPKAEVHYGWIVSDYTYNDRAMLVGQPEIAYPTNAHARQMKRWGKSILRIRTNVPVTLGMKVRVYYSEYLIYHGGKLYQPSDAGWPADEKFCFIVPETEGV